MKKIKDLNFKLNIKSIVLFEQITGKSFYLFGEEDLEDLIYAIVSVNNPDMMLSKEQLEFILEKNQKMASTIVQELSDELMYITNFEPKEQPKKMAISKDEEEEKTPGKLSDIIGMLIIHYGLDPHYVMYEMSLWEVNMYARGIEEKRKEDMTNQRFWTYLSMLPHIDAKKVGGPEKLVPFPWEETKQDEAKKFMEENTEAINNFFKKQENKDE